MTCQRLGSVDVIRRVLGGLGILFFASQACAADDANPGAYPVADESFRRDLVSISLDDVVAAGLATGVYKGSPKVLANKDSYDAAFYDTLASVREYLDSDRARWRNVPVPQVPPPPCDRPQPTKFDADSCRYVNALFRELEKTDSALARENRKRVRRGRDVWFKGTFGNQDLYTDYLGLAVLGEYPDYTSWLDTRNRDGRFRRFGLINDPDCRPGIEETFWLDDCRDPHSTGILGVRKYPAPGMDGFAIGFACASCHVAFDPTNPPKDPANPEWENLMGGIGNQYLRQAELFVLGKAEDHFLRVTAAAQRPGTSDTSLVANDYIHNPGTINAIMNTHNRPVFEHRMRDPITGEVKLARTRHLLKGGEDSVGERLALLRVYVNIGMCSAECWTPNFPEIGALLFDVEQKPMRVKECAAKCEAWNQADSKMDDLLAYLLSIGPTYLDKAVDVDGTPGPAYIDDSLVPEGRKVFIDNCARCHSSRTVPEFAGAADVRTLREFHKGHIFGGFHNWRREFTEAALRSLEFAEFLNPASGVPRQIAEGAQDWLGNDRRIPFTEIGVNRCRSMHSNHMPGHIFDEFASLTYQESPPHGAMPRSVNPLLPLVGGTNPFGAELIVQGGPGYMRNISLLGVWSSAPLLHNNALGPFPTQPDGTPDYTVKGRVRAFEAAMRELLMSDDPSRKTHRRPVVWRVPTEVEVPAREDGKGPISLTMPKGSPIGYMTSVNPHRPIYSACDDYVENKGHQFGIGLSEDEKAVLIEFLKTL